MSVRMTGRYLGNKKVELLHELSGTRITTAAPLDNNGDGSSFSPTDLFSASLGACMMTVMGIVADRDGIDLTRMTMSLEKHMNQSPRRVARIPVTLHLPRSLTPEQRTKLEKTAHACPVNSSLHSDIEAPVEFVYDV